MQVPGEGELDHLFTDRSGAEAKATIQAFLSPDKSRATCIVELRPLQGEGPLLATFSVPLISVNQSLATDVTPERAERLAKLPAVLAETGFFGKDFKRSSDYRIYSKVTLRGKSSYSFKTSIKEVVRGVGSSPVERTLSTTYVGFPPGKAISVRTHSVKNESEGVNWTVFLPAFDEIDERQFEVELLQPRIRPSWVRLEEWLRRLGESIRDVKVLLPRQSLRWAVVHAADEHRIPAQGHAV